VGRGERRTQQRKKKTGTTEKKTRLVSFIIRAGVELAGSGVLFAS
jgi:hypothetical protein